MVYKIWQFWDSVESDGKYKRVVCKYCNGHEQIKHAAKCRRHTLMCGKVPSFIKDLLDSKSSVTITTNGEEPRTSDELEVHLITADVDAPINCSEDTTVMKATVQANSSRNRKETKVLPKGGRIRNSNILSAALCLIKEMDVASLEVLDTAIHCRLEELYQN